MSLQVKQQIVAVMFDRVDANPMDQQGQECDDNRTSNKPLAIANSHRRTPFFSWSANAVPCGNAITGCRGNQRSREAALHAGKTA
jgi:hypothetical protein